jgi:polar amino acid transport system substrate-binding protein
MAEHITMKRLIGAILFLLLVGDRSALADGHLLLYFHQRPPYSWLDDSSNVVGVVAEPAERALRKAGIHFSWAAMPSARQMETIKNNEEKACGVGWFKRPEREEFARFSQPIYHDRDMVIVARRADIRLRDDPSIETLFRDPDLTLLTKVGYSYGAVMDAKLAELRPRREETATDNLHMLDMIALGRADFTLMSAEEADHLLQIPGPTSNTLATYTFSGAPKGEERYLMCSKQVPQTMINAFNAALNAN